MEQQRIINRIQQLSRADLKDIQRFAGLFHYIKLKKGEQISITANYSHCLIFLHHGLLHHYIPGVAQTTTTKVTVAIYQPDDLIISSINDQHQIQQIEALQDSELGITDRAELTDLLPNNPQLLLIHLELSHHQHIQTLAHLRLLQSATAIERYQALADRFGKHLFLIPTQYRAAYIGISRKHLSRLNYSLLKSHQTINQQHHEHQ